MALVDRKGIAGEARFGNAGAFAFSDVLPLASPGIVAKALRWLLARLGPHIWRVSSESDPPAGNHK